MWHYSIICHIHPIIPWLFPRTPTKRVVPSTQFCIPQHSIYWHKWDISRHVSLIGPALTNCWRKVGKLSFQIFPTFSQDGSSWVHSSTWMAAIKNQAEHFNIRKPCISEFLLAQVKQHTWWQKWLQIYRNKWNVGHIHGWFSMSSSICRRVTYLCQPKRRSTPVHPWVVSPLLSSGGWCGFYRSATIWGSDVQANYTGRLGEGINHTGHLQDAAGALSWSCGIGMGTVRVQNFAAYPGA